MDDDSICISPHKRCHGKKIPKWAILYTCGYEKYREEKDDYFTPQLATYFGNDNN